MNVFARLLSMPADLRLPARAGSPRTPSSGPCRRRSRPLAAASALAIALAVAALASDRFAATFAQAARMPVSEIREGMVGEGYSVFEGTRRDPFKAHILGVLENAMGPRRSLILARLEGGPLAEAGVIAGMSGSPVYIDGRLIGAVGYSLGSFSKEPIAGITPIAEMTDLAAIGAARAPGTRVSFELPLSQDGMAAALRTAFESSAFATRAGDVQPLAGGADVARLAVGLRPIATPLSVAGLDGEALRVLSSFFRDTGFVPVAGTVAGGSAPAIDDRPLQAGDAIGVSLVSGDLNLGATGTVTLVEGPSVYAFGHPFYNLGPTSFPMTRAWVHAVLPSLFSSVKLSSLGTVIGTFQQDRASAISGTLGVVPATIPLRISLDGARGQKRSFDLRLVDDQLFTPLLTYVSILSVLQSYERETGSATFQVKGEARVKGHGTVALEDIFAGDQPSIPAAAYVATPITALLRNDRAPVQIEGVDLTITAAEQPRTATLERVWIDETRVRPGRDVTLKVLTRSWRGEDTVRAITVPIPANAHGPLTLLVADGARMAQWEQREWRRALDVQSVNQLIRVFNSARRNNRLYVRLVSSSPGAVVNGEPMPALPPSVLAVLDSDRDAGRITSMRQAILGEWDLPVGQAIAGSRTLTLSVESN
jgi:hypothetical protein